MKAEWTNRDSLSVEETTGQNSKSILVIDTPKNCAECQLNSHTDYDFDVCWVTQGKGECPLRSLPQKKEIKNSIQYRGLAEEYRKEGWNACLDAIEGETE